MQASFRNVVLGAVVPSCRARRERLPGYRGTGHLERQRSHRLRLRHHRRRHRPDHRRARRDQPRRRQKENRQRQRPPHRVSTVLGETLRLPDTAATIIIAPLPRLAQTLGGVQITAQATHSSQLQPFYDRWLMRQKGALSATFIGPEEIELRHPNNRSAGHEVGDRRQREIVQRKIFSPLARPSRALPRFDGSSRREILERRRNFRFGCACRSEQWLVT